jgi:hypothetical protein
MGTAVIKLPSETGAVISSSCSPKFALGMHVTLSASPVAFNRGRNKLSAPNLRDKWVARETCILPLPVFRGQ